MNDDIVLNPSQLLTALTAAIKAKPRPRRILIKGAPGIGKTMIVKTLAKLQKAALVIMHPSVADPTDFKGLPFVVDGKAQFLSFGDLDLVLNAKEPTIMFLDDLGQGSTAVQAAAMQLFDKLLDNPNVTIIAATNERSHRAGVTGLLEPVKSRFDSILKLVTDFSSWKVWAMDHDIDFRVLGYLEQQPTSLFKFEASADIVNQPCPRTWESASAILGMDLSDEDVRFAMLIGAVGQGAATSFNAWLRIAEEAPTREEVIADPNNVRIPKEPSALYAVAASLALSFEKKEFPPIAVFMERLYAAEFGEMCGLIFKDVFRKDENIKTTPAFAKLAKGPMAKLIVEAVKFNQTEKKGA